MQRLSARTTTPLSPERAPAVRITELHGLRGLALALVVLFHLFGAGRVSGGVDVFLLVSGFLVTGSLVRRAEARNLRLRDQYARHAARLVPAAAVVLSAVALLTVLVLPRGTWVQNARELAASALYLENWELIASQLSYDAAGASTSPLQHFWSLAVQGQFFLVWPLVVLGLAAVARRAGRSLRTVVGWFTFVAVAASFAWAVHLVGVAQPVAYFHSASRFWEIGAGALLAIVLPRLRLPDGVRDVIAWLGLAMVVASGFIVDGASTFPGPWALWPVTGALLVLAGAGTRTGRGPGILLDTAPLRFVADISYSLYLWHWPLLIGYLAWREYPAVGWRGGAVVLGASVALAWVTERLVERRARAGALLQGNRVTLLRSGAAVAALALVATGGATALAAQDRTSVAALETTSSDHPGALALGSASAPTSSPGDVVPPPHLAMADRSWVLEDGCVQVTGTKDPGAVDVLECVLNDPATPTRTIVMVGDSHMVQWEPAMTVAAQDAGWRVVLFAKHSCRMASEFDDVRSNPTCEAWNASVLAELARSRPDAVVVMGTRTYEQKDGEYVSQGEVAAWRELDALGIPVVTIRDNPRFARDVPACVEKHPEGAECARARASMFAPRNPLESTDGVPRSAGHVDLTDYFCGPERCETVIGNVLVYRDQHHITRTYARSLAPAFTAELRAEAPWLFTD